MKKKIENTWERSFGREIEQIASIQAFSRLIEKTKLKIFEGSSVKFFQIFF